MVRMRLREETYGADHSRHEDGRTIGATPSDAALRHGTGFNYPQTMCLGNDGDRLRRQSRQREQLRHAGQPRQGRRSRRGGTARRVLPPTARRTASAIWPFGVAVDNNGDVSTCSDEWTNTISVFDANGKFIRKWGTTGSGDGELRGPAGIVCREERQRDRRRQRQQSPAGLHAGRQACRPVRQGRQRRRRVQPAVGHHARQGRQHLRRRLEEPPRAEAVAAGQVPDVDRRVRQASGAARMPLP